MKTNQKLLNPALPPPPHIFWKLSNGDGCVVCFSLGQEHILHRRGDRAVWVMLLKSAKASAFEVIPSLSYSQQDWTCCKRGQQCPRASSSAFYKELFDHSCGSRYRYKSMVTCKVCGDFWDLISILHDSPALMRRADQVSFLWRKCLSVDLEHCALRQHQLSIVKLLTSEEHN